MKPVDEVYHDVLMSYVTMVVEAGPVAWMGIGSAVFYAMYWSIRGR